jgi:hypothetical protein
MNQLPLNPECEIQGAGRSVFGLKCRSSPLQSLLRGRLFVWLAQPRTPFFFREWLKLRVLLVDEPFARTRAVEVQGAPFRF